MARMFDEVAPVYDRLNTLMTLGVDARWRKRAVAETRLRAGDSAVDVCCGTGKLAELIAERVGPFGRIEGIDVSPEMIGNASRRLHSLVQAHFAVGSALELPFEDGTFDAATIGFGLRNLPDFEAGFREIARVVRPGGRVVCLELSLPRSRTVARAYHGTFRRTAPVAARILGAPRDAYAYLPQSLEGFPNPDQIVESMRSAGLRDVRYVRLAGGAVALHWGLAPASEA
jgi:demethylmenaquinone methyltransferase/2-methoxy-6-polyprenyl-1,4-benzoquinol methylase